MKFLVPVAAISMLFSLQAVARPNLDLTCSNGRISMSIVEANSAKGEIRGIVVSAKQLNSNVVATSQPRFIEVDPNSSGSRASYLSRDFNTAGNMGLNVIHVMIDSNSQSLTSRASNYKIDALVYGANGGERFTFTRDNCQGAVPKNLID